MHDRQAFEYEYILAKLAEVEEALARIDRSGDPLAESETRRVLVEQAGRLIGALAVYDESTRALN
jgi:hypothetical protein